MRAQGLSARYAVPSVSFQGAFPPLSRGANVPDKSTAGSAGEWIRQALPDKWERVPPRPAPRNTGTRPGEAAHTRSAAPALHTPDAARRNTDDRSDERASRAQAPSREDWRVQGLSRA